MFCVGIGSFWVFSGSDFMDLVLFVLNYFHFGNGFLNWVFLFYEIGLSIRILFSLCLIEVFLELDVFWKLNVFAILC